jgi:hypothetical protein
VKEGSSPTLSAYSRSKRFLIAETTPEKEKKPSLLEVYKQALATYQKSSGPMPG